ncbi:hypothetical protein [Sulfurimonas sp.]|uniref:hypothetical protein n=1 Tax=Sulfurimonas sp. TaxID=2022749 RepID=UPI003563F968
MDYGRDLNNSRNNQMYYNQLKRDNLARRKRTRRKNKSFGSQNVDVKEMVWAPDGYEGIFGFIYFLFIPYIVGAVFLFFAVAQADFDSFMKLNTAAFFVVWAIGYEIVASLALLIIFWMFMKFDSDK